MVLFRSNGLVFVEVGLRGEMGISAGRNGIIILFAYVLWNDYSVSFGTPRRVCL